MFPPLNPPIRQWTGYRIWIIGASSGIGAAVAKQLADKGARLAISGRRENELRQLARTINNTMVMPLDITDFQAVQKTATDLEQAWGGIDVVLVAAGIFQDVAVSHFSPAGLPAVKQTLNIHLTGFYHVLAAVLPGLIKQQSGGLAVVSSVAGYNGLPHAMSYAPSKAALNNLCEGLYLELHPLGLAIYRICPGFVDTPMTAGSHFPMPALITANQAAKTIVAGLERGDFEIHFPKHFTRFLKILQWLPRRLYFLLMKTATRRLDS